MKINSIKIENFLSIKSMVINFDDYSGITRVIGENKDTTPVSSNGAGKSALIEAISFGLFGKTLRKTSERSIINKYTSGKCRVTLTINENVVIERTKKAPKLIFTVGGKNYTQESIQATQRYLEHTLNTNFQVFMASVVFGQQNSMSFLTATPEEKRAIMQSFLNTNDLFLYRKKIKSLKTKYLAKKKLNTTLQIEATQKREKLVVKMEKLKKLKIEANDILSSDKVKYIDKFSISELQEKERAYHETELEFRSKEHELYEVEKKVNSLKVEISEFKSESCEFCGEEPSIQSAHRIKLKTDLDAAYSHRTFLRKTIKHLKRDLDAQYVPINVQDFELIETYKSLDKELKIHRSNKRQLTRSINGYSKNIVVTQKEYDLMRFWEHAFSEQGIVKCLIKNILTFFNERVSFYLSVLSTNQLQISFDELLQDTLFMDGEEIFFESLSGGEKKRVSLSVMLSLNDILFLSGKEKSNVVFFDEVADSLDPPGVEGLFELMQGLSADKTLFVITHNEYLSSLLENYAEDLTITKSNNLTTVKKKKRPRNFNKIKETNEI